MDVIRGFALFGVLWANFNQEGFTVPTERVVFLAPALVESITEFLVSWLVHGKAQALFSILFGLGFALFLQRATENRLDGTLLYVRRLTFLLVLGIAHAIFLWCGDILNAYALVGFLLLFTRRWPSWLLLTAGVLLSVFSGAFVSGVGELLIPHRSVDWMDMDSAGVAGRFAAFSSGDYGAFVRANLSFLKAVLPSPMFMAFVMWVLGRFLLGSWIFRQQWFHSYSRNEARIAPAHAALLLSAGLLMALPGPLTRVLHLKASGLWYLALQTDHRAAQLVLALGYAATLAALYQSGRLRLLLRGLGKVGRMALTNYICQSVIFFLYLDGFGLGLLPFVSPTFCLVSAIAFFALQIALSWWWLSRYQFGPAEWLWRSFTYSRWQPLRKIA